MAGRLRQGRLPSVQFWVRRAPGSETGLFGDFFLARQSPPPCSLRGAGVGVGALAMHLAQPAAMPQATIAAEVHEPLDVHGHFTPQIALDLVFAVDQLADARTSSIGELVDPTLVGDAEAVADLRRLGRADTVDIPQPNGYTLVGRDVHAGNTRHACHFLSVRRGKPDVCWFAPGEGREFDQTAPPPNGGAPKERTIVPAYESSTRRYQDLASSAE